MPEFRLILILLIAVLCQPVHGEDSVQGAKAAPSSDFAPPGDLRPPTVHIQGHLHLQPDPKQSFIEPLVDSYNAATTPEWDVRHLPAVTVDLVQDGNDVIPVQRGTQASPHLYWEWIFEPGKAWDEPDTPSWTRVSLPFSLQERNQNCTHNGLMSFSFRADGKVSPIDYQVGSETCKYLKANLWGRLAAEYRPAKISNAATVIASHRQLLSSRLPVKSLSSLADDHPELDPVVFLPPGPEDVTVYGLVIDGVHYRGGCETRFGPHPFCDWLDLPSYSTAKSIFAGLVFIYLEDAYPGFAETPVTELVPECRLADGRWEDVNMRHLLNMTTGNYDSLVHEADEGAENVGDFFIPEAHADKLNFSCNAYLRKSPPGEVPVYHTFDTYILGTAMNDFIRQQEGAKADIFTDILMKKILGPLALSPTAHGSRRTYDAAAQPFTGYGLTWNPDDIARIAQWLNQTPEPEDLEDIRRSPGFSDAMFRNPATIRRWQEARGEAYSNGFWGHDMGPAIKCNEETWIPFMSGYGGNVVALIPNGSVYYYFSDGDRFKWATAAAELNKAANYCDNK